MPVKPQEMYQHYLAHLLSLVKLGESEPALTDCPLYIKASNIQIYSIYKFHDSHSSKNVNSRVGSGNEGYGHKLIMLNPTLSNSF